MIINKIIQIWIYYRFNYSQLLNICKCKLKEKIHNVSKNMLNKYQKNRIKHVK